MLSMGGAARSAAACQHCTRRPPRLATYMQTARPSELATVTRRGVYGGSRALVAAALASIRCDASAVTLSIRHAQAATWICAIGDHVARSAAITYARAGDRKAKLVAAALRCTTDGTTIGESLWLRMLVGEGSSGECCTQRIEKSVRRLIEWIVTVDRCHDSERGRERDAARSSRDE